MDVNLTVDISPFFRPTAQVKPAQPAPVREEQSPLNQAQATSVKPAAKAAVGYTQSVELIRELKPVNVHPKNHAAIDTILNIAHYDGGESIINTYA